MTAERAGRGNARVKRVRRLVREAPLRREEGRCVVEGMKVVEEVLRGELPIELALAADSLDGAPELLARLDRRADRLLRVPDDLLASVADTSSPQGVLLVVGRPEPGPPPRAGETALLVAWELQDPGNLGALVRSAAASGCCGALFARRPGGARPDPLSPRALRASAGSGLDLPLFEWEGEPGSLTGALAELGWRCVALAPRGGRPPEEVDLAGPVALLVGAEGAGLPEEAMRGAGLVTLPLEAGVESLGAAAAGAVACFEAARQRRLARSRDRR